MALATLRRYVATRTAALARVGGIDPLDPVRSLFVQAPDKKPPPRRKNLAVQPRLLPYILARLVSTAPGRPDHVTDLQILNSDKVESASQLRGSLFAPILASIGLSGSKPRSLSFDTGMTVGASRRAGQLALKSAQPLLASLRQTRHPEQFTGRRGYRDSYAKVNANHFAGSRHGHWVWLSRERYMPAADSVARHPVGLHAVRHRAGQPEPDPTDLGYPYLARSSIQSADTRRCYSDDPKSIAPPNLSPCRPAMRSAEGVRHGLGEVSDCLLLHYDAADTKPFKFSACFRKLTTLFDPSGCASTPLSPPRLLLTCEVPDEPGMSAMFQERRLLSRVRRQTITGHNWKLSARSDKTREVKQRLC